MKVVNNSLKLTDEENAIEFVGKPLFIQRVTHKHKFAKLKIGDACTLHINGTSNRVKVIKKKAIKNGKEYALMFELS